MERLTDEQDICISCVEFGGCNGDCYLKDVYRKLQKYEDLGFSPEEIAYIHGWIDKDQLLEAAKHYGKSPYGKHLKSVAEGKVRY